MIVSSSYGIAELYYAKRRYKFQRDWSELSDAEKALWIEVVDQVIDVLRGLDLMQSQVGRRR
jgi:hypothetical protein